MKKYFSNQLIVTDEAHSESRVSLLAAFLAFFCFFRTIKTPPHTTEHIARVAEDKHGTHTYHKKTNLQKVPETQLLTRLESQLLDQKIVINLGLLSEKLLRRL